MSHTSSLADRTRRKGVQIRRAAAKRAAFVQRIHPDTCYVTIDGELVMASHHPKLDMQCDSFWRAQRGQQRATRQDERGQLAYEAGMQDLEGEGEDPLDELYETGADEIDDPYGSMADWERELLVEAVLPPIEYTVGAHEPSYPYDEGKYRDDEVLVGNHDSYSVVGGIHHLNPGYGLDAVFGEAYLGGNCGFSVKTQP